VCDFKFLLRARTSYVCTVRHVLASMRVLAASKLIVPMQLRAKMRNELFFISDRQNYQD